MASRLRVGLIGLGKVALDIHVPACRAVSDLEIACACEPATTRRQDFERRTGMPVRYSDAASMLASEHPDLVIVATPPQTHFDLCLLALQQGAHVFCEKPFAANLEQADALIVEADARARLLWVNNQYRHMKMYAETQAHLARGDFGRAFFLQCWQQMYHPPSMESNWRAQLEQSTLFEFGTHALDLVCFFFDALPLSVSAHMPRVQPGTQADVLVQMTMRFPAERLATLAFNRVSRAPERYLEMRLDCEQASVRMSLGGVARASLDWSRSLGRPTVRFGLVRGGEARAESGGRSRVIAVEPRQAFASATAERLRQFAAAIRSGQRSNEAARLARDVLAIALAGYESARSGSTVQLVFSPHQVKS
jgi:predicted dehydrogenase